MEYYRNLPHLHPTQAVFFITTRLYGSLPAAVIHALQDEQKQALRKITEAEKQEGTNRYFEKANQSKRYFARFDALLDKPTNGPYWLSEPAVAQVVIDALYYQAQTAYDLVAYCIMSNHIHVVINTKEKETAERPLYRIIQSFKRHTARQANVLLQRQGEFWQPESYDHVVRNEAELKRIIAYVLNNPIKTGLVENWQEWPYSYVNEAYL